MERFGYGSKINHYLTEVICKLFFDFTAAIANRIEGSDYSYNWYHLVAFIIFVMVNRHGKCDKETIRVLVKGLHYL